MVDSFHSPALATLPMVEGHGVDGALNLPLLVTHAGWYVSLTSAKLMPHMLASM